MTAPETNNQICFRIDPDLKKRFLSAVRDKCVDKTALFSKWVEDWLA
ncbi:MAG: hypothetical protein JW839_02115 [Candidatus Lokiarchaeota archaeon]|nr:hypothetical protein [Candidatus Lokiarchaeota archaeon]